MPLSQLQTGPQNLADGSTSGNARGGRQGDAIVSELHGRFYEQAYRGNLYSAGSSLTALSANTITLSATTTPIVGVWNPSGSGVNLSILQASLQCVANNLTSGAGPGAFVWAASINNAALTLGAAPINRRTLTGGASLSKAFNGGVALTGLTNNLVILEGADFTSPSGLTYTTLASTSILVPTGGVQNIDGSLLVPPGGVLALLNTVSSTTFSVYSRLLWEEVPI